MTREELIALGRKIISGQGTEQATQEIIELFNANVPHPNGASLFYYPESDNAGTIDISKYNPAVEEAIDKCLGFRPIML